MSQKSIGEYLVDHKVVDYDKSLEQFQNLRDAGTVLSFDMVRAIVEEMERFNEDVYTASQFIIAPKVKERDKFNGKTHNYETENGGLFQSTNRKDVLCESENSGTLLE